MVECHRVTGEDCFIAKVYLLCLDQLDEILDQFLAVGQTTTSVVQSSPARPAACRCQNRWGAIRLKSRCDAPGKLAGCAVGPMPISLVLAASSTVVLR